MHVSSGETVTKLHENLGLTNFDSHQKCSQSWTTIFDTRIPQRSNAVRVCNMNIFNGGKLPGNSKHFFKTSKDKAVPGKRSFKRWMSVEKFPFVYL